MAEGNGNGHAQAFVVPRGCAVCPKCHKTMIRRDVAPTHRPAIEGELIRRRAYRCLECGGYITSREISDGESSKGFLVR